MNEIEDSLEEIVFVAIDEVKLDRFVRVFVELISETEA